MSFDMDTTSTQLDPKRIYTTAKQVFNRIQEMADSMSLGSGLADRASEVVNWADSEEKRLKEAEKKERILRLAGWLVLFIIVVFGFVLICWWPDNFRFERPHDLTGLVQIIEPTLGSIFFIATILLGVVTWHSRTRRSQALKRLHELRTLAHVVHSHQMKKSLQMGAQAVPGAPINLDQFKVYVGHCSDLLAVVAKLAALNAQDVNDSVVLDASDRIERLAHDLSEDMWRKVTSAERSDFAPVGD